MNAPLVRLPVVLMSLASLCACSGLPTFTGPSEWFTRENQIIVSEMVNSSQCNAPDEQMRVTALAGGAAVKAWERERGVSLTGETAVPSGQFAVVDLGKPRAAGHGLAVSRVGGLKDDILLLKITLFAPDEGVELPPELTSPCALVKLPDLPFGKIRVVDQTGRIRASGPGLAR